MVFSTAGVPSRSLERVIMARLRFPLRSKRRLVGATGTRLNRTPNSSRPSSPFATGHLGLWEQGVRVLPARAPPEIADRVIEPWLDDPFPDYDTEPVMMYANG